MPHFAMNTDSSIFVAGHRGMVGSAICRSLQAHGYHNIRTRTRAELDLMDAAAVDAYLAESRPDAVVVAAARVGGIHANNTYPAEFIHENIAIAHNLIHSSD